jgi:orotate phosphoribosyltransferase
MNSLDAALAASVIEGRNNMQPIGAFGEISIQHFVDLMSAAHSAAHLSVLADALIELIRDSGLDVTSYGGVVGPKLGNVLLAHAVANKLKLRSGFVRHSILCNRYIEGQLTPGDKLLLVDDVSSEGKLLSDCVRNAKEDGYFVDTVFTVVDRVEGDADRVLHSMGVTLKSCRRLGDYQLARLVRDWRDAGGQ